MSPSFTIVITEPVRTLRREGSLIWIGIGEMRECIIGAVNSFLDGKDLPWTEHEGKNSKKFQEDG